jgi:hypothetical protein
MDLRLRSLVRRRPSASLVVSFVALFVALGGAGYAAIRIPANSVGSAQLQNNSVGNFKLKSNAVGPKKIINGSVGAKQVNSTQVQLRVATPCVTATAVQSVGLSGTVTCTPTLPNEYGTTAPAVTLGSGSTQIATESLPAGSPFLILAYPRATITGSMGLSQRVEVDCTVSVPSGTSTTKSLAVVTDDTNSVVGTIPLVLPVASATSAQTATVNCTDTATPSTPAPTVAVDTTINAIQTASNN